VQPTKHLPKASRHEICLQVQDTELVRAKCIEQSADSPDMITEGRLCAPTTEVLEHVDGKDCCAILTNHHRQYASLTNLHSGMKVVGWPQ
jgi:hypothetical protein